jgi:hypothetical protein
MFKVACFGRFSRSLEAATAERHWADVHGPLAAATEVVRYAQNRVLGTLPDVRGITAGRVYFDGYSLGWWPDRAAFEATMGSLAWAAVTDDARELFDGDALPGMRAQVRENVVIDGPTSPYKVVWVVRFKAGRDPIAAHQYWEGTHGQLFPRELTDRYVQNHVVGPIDGDGRLDFDGFSECWFASEAAFVRAIESDAWAAGDRDAADLFDMSRLWDARLDERLLKPQER